MSTALLKAAAAGQNERLQALLDDGANIDFADKMPGRTALIEAAIAGHIETLCLLNDKGANLDQHDLTMGFTALGWAAHSGDLHILERLLDAGAAVDATGNDYLHSPLMVAALQGRVEIVAALLAAGADVQMQTRNGRNALSMAQERGHAEVVALLLKHGARPPVPLEEVYLPWPADVDHSDPASVLRGYILAMNRWETECHEHSEQVGVRDLDWDFIRQGLAGVFERFCTLKPRPQGRGNSIGWPPDYTPGEALVSIDNKGRRATLMTRQAPDGPMRYEALYTAVRTGDTWRLDSKKTRPWGTLNWDKGIL
ncbi:hypothetical protein PS3A_61380 [Pseudomonas sp. 3A(2025)]